MATCSTCASTSEPEPRTLLVSGGARNYPCSFLVSPLETSHGYALSASSYLDAYQPEQLLIAGSKPYADQELGATRVRFVPLEELGPAASELVGAG